MEKIYIAMVDTPGIFASLIHHAIQRPYIHVVLSLDPELEEAYSIGRRNPFIPYFSGFEREDKKKICRAFPTARYRIYSLDCEKEQKENIREQLKRCYKNRFFYHYCVLGLPNILLQKPFYQEAHYTCSSFIARLLARNGIDLFSKHFSLVTPADFYDLKNEDILFEGLLVEYMNQKKNQVKQEMPKGVLYEG